jgi:hypothetical protein
VPVPLFYTFTADEVKVYVKILIDIVGKNGGLIVYGGSSFDEAKHENVMAMVDFTKEYGQDWSDGEKRCHIQAHTYHMLRIVHTRFA